MIPPRVTIHRAAELTGYTEDAIETKVRRGIWQRGVIAHKAPDGRILIDMEAYDRWTRQESKTTTARFVSDSRSTVGGVSRL